MYSKTVWSHFNEPKNVGRIKSPDAEGKAGSLRGGMFMLFTAKLKGEVIKEVKFQTYGCAPAIAAGSYLTEAIQGKTISEAALWNEERLIEGLGGLPPEKLHCASLAIEALNDLTRQLSEKST